MMRTPELTYPPIWVIYDRPGDAPDKIVVRVWYGETPGDAKHVETIQAARNFAVEQGACFCLGRMPGDEPQIVEAWI